jgi:succinoglycan biosynthesis transport protein ExoP
MNKPVDEKQINLRDVWHIVVKRKWLVILPFILAVTAAYAGSFLLTQRYESRVTIIVKESELIGPELQRMTTATGFDAVRSERDLKLWQQSITSEIKAPATLLKVIDELGLADDQEMQVKIDRLVAAYPQYSRRELTNIALIEKLQNEHVRVGFVGQNLVAIECESKDPLQARKMAQVLADVFREEQIREDLTRIRAMQEFSTEQLAIYKKEWEDAEEDLADFKKNYTRSNAGEKIADGVIDGITAEMDQAKLRMEDIVDQKNFTAANLESADIDTASLIPTAELIGYISILNGINEQKASLMERYPRTYPKVLEVTGRFNRGLDSLDVICERTVSSIFPGLRGATFDQAVEYLVLTAKIDVVVAEQITLNHTLAKLRNRYTTWPDYEVELKRFEQKVTTKKDIYLKFNTQLLGSRINEDAFRKEAENRYKIIEPATLPLAPVYPDRLRIVALGCALGFVLGFGAVLLAEVLDSSLRTIEETESYLGLKVLGTIPRIETRRRTHSAQRSEPVEISQ